MEQFTFYDIYYDALVDLSAEQKGAFIKRLCKLMFEDKEETSKDEVVNITFEMIRETVEESKSKEKEGKTSYYLNKIMHHFTFRKSFYRLINSFKKDEDAGNFIRIICDYMFRNVEPDIEKDSKYISYFNMFKKGLDISKHRAEAGSKGGKSKKQPKETTTTPETEAEDYEDLFEKELEKYEELGEDYYTNQ